MQNRTKQIESKKTTISELETQIQILRDKMESVISDIYDLKSHRVDVLRKWYNARIDKSETLERQLGYVGSGFLPSHEYITELIQKVLKKQTLNNKTYRTENDLYYNMTYYINKHYRYYINEVEVKQLVKKYKTQNAKIIIKKLEFENKLKARKQRLTALIVGNRGERINERKRMDKTDKIVRWYNVKVEPFANKVRNYFMNELDKLGLAGSYLRFNAGISEIVKWFKDITKNHTITLEQLKRRIYKNIKEQYKGIVRGYKNSLEKEVKEKALQKHELATMTAKQRKALQFEKWSKVKSVLDMFSGSIEITEKIDFTNYVPLKEVKTIKDDTTTISIF